MDTQCFSLNSLEDRLSIFILSLTPYVLSSLSLSLNCTYLVLTSSLHREMMVDSSSMMGNQALTQMGSVTCKAPWSSPVENIFREKKHRNVHTSSNKLLPTTYWYTEDLLHTIHTNTGHKIDSTGHKTLKLLAKMKPILSCIELHQHTKTYLLHVPNA